MSSLSALCTKLAAYLRLLHSCGQHLGQGARIWYTGPFKGPWSLLLTPRGSLLPWHCGTAA